jgi:tyrosyl-tRNA synthetase
MYKDVQELLSRGVTEVIDKKHLEERLQSGEKLRIKLGIDPTSPNIHIGRAVLLWKLRAFQDQGHTAVFIVGDFTALIGDTSDKETERPMLSEEAVKANMQTYLDQALKILDPKKTETHHNSSWLSKLGFIEIGKMAGLFGLHEFESREVIAKRLKSGKRVALQEVLYPIMQGYDSVAIKADVELGGTDQRFNLLSGRTIQPLYEQESQDILMTEILEGTDGRKMSSSWGNVINILDAANDMYGKVMSVRDDLVPKYFELATRVPLSEVNDILKLHPKEAKMRLAREITALYHGEGEAQHAEEDFNSKFTKGSVPTDVPEAKAGKDESLVDVLIREGLVKSKTEFNRLESAGAIEEKENGVYRIGKHRFLKIVRG